MFLRIGLSTLWPLAIATLAACRGAPGAASDHLGLALSPASFGRTLSLQQQVHVESAGRTADFDAALDISPDSLTLVGMAFGQRMLTLRYDGVKLEERRNSRLPREVRGADILSDVQMALWPAGAVRAALPAGWTLADSDTLRTFSRDGRAIVTIAYDAVPHWASHMTIRNLRYDYRLEIGSVVGLSVTGDCYLNELGVVCSLGSSRAEVGRRLFAGDAGVAATERYSPGRLLPVGCVSSPLPALDDWPVGMRSRNNQLVLAAAGQLRHAVGAAVSRYGAGRVAVVVGTSTSGIGESEPAVREYLASGDLPHGFAFAQQELHSPAAFLARALDVAGPAYVHSSACASGAKAMAAAARLLRLGLADAVVTGGADSLCAFTVAGFRALNLVSERRCNPLSVNRDGINIGEAAALFLMTREPATVGLRGWGESSDGHHFSAPDPTGRGARAATERALARARLKPADVEYVNLHGTATPANDAMESAVVHGLFGERVPVSGTKAMTGHTLGAAGALEAAFCWMTMQDDNREGLLPPHLWDGEADPALAPLTTVPVGGALGRPPRHTLSNSFAFGGANAVLVFGRA